MKAIVVTDRSAGTAGMKLMERPEPRAAINDVVIQVHASGFTRDELTWPATWTDRLGRDRTPSIPGHELAGVVTDLGYGATGLSVGQRVRPHELDSRRHPGGICSSRSTQPRAAARGR
jgi:D-arabinose 1-dehydrogenase-like Zn-dependent alcohol dehydrogenase